MTQYCCPKKNGAVLYGSQNYQKKSYSSDSYKAFIAETVVSVTVLAKASTCRWLIGSVHCPVCTYSFQLCKTKQPDTTKVYLVLQIRSNMHFFHGFSLPTAVCVCKWFLFQCLHSFAHAVNCPWQFIDLLTIFWFCQQYTKLIRTNVGSPCLAIPGSAELTPCQVHALVYSKCWQSLAKTKHWNQVPGIEVCKRHQGAGLWTQVCTRNLNMWIETKHAKQPNVLLACFTEKKSVDYTLQDSFDAATWQGWKWLIQTVTHVDHHWCCNDSLSTKLHKRVCVTNRTFFRQPLFTSFDVSLSAFCSVTNSTTMFAPELSKKIETNSLQCLCHWRVHVQFYLNLENTVLMDFSFQNIQLRFIFIFTCYLKNCLHISTMRQFVRYLHMFLYWCFHTIMTETPLYFAARYGKRFPICSVIAIDNLLKWLRVYVKIGFNNWIVMFMQRQIKLTLLFAMEIHFGPLGSYNQSPDAECCTKPLHDKFECKYVVLQQSLWQPKIWHESI